MFKLYQPAYVNSLEAYRKLEKSLEDEAENQKSEVNKFNGVWMGLTAEKFSTTYNELLTTGPFAQSYQLAKRIREILEEALPEINRLMARCEQLGDQLMQDDFCDPILPAAEDTTRYNDGYLILNDEYVEAFNQACDEAMQAAEGAKLILDSMMSECSGIIDFGETKEMLEVAYRKVNRIKNYKLAFNQYVSGISKLDDNLASLFRQSMNDDMALANPKWNIMNVSLNDEITRKWIMTGKISDVKTTSLNLSEFHINIDSITMLNDRFTKEYNSKLDAFKKEIINSYETNISNRAVELLEKDAEGVYYFEKLLQQDANLLTDEDIQALTCIYEEACLKFEKENAVSECILEKTIMERFASGLYISDVGTHTTGTMFYMSTVTQCYVKSNDALIDKMLNYVKYSEGRALSYNYLMNIYGTETLAAESTSRDSSEFMNIKVARVSFDYCENGMGFMVKTEFYPDEDNKLVKYKNADCYLSGYTKALQYVNTLKSSSYEALTKLGYSKEDIANMLCIANNDKDIQVIEKMMAGKESEIFSIDPTLLSSDVKSTLAVYAITLARTDKMRGENRLETFINEMISPESPYAEEYMKEMAIYTGLQRDLLAGSMWSTDITDDVLNCMETVDAVASLYQTLSLEASDLCLWYVQLTRKEINISVSDLAIDDNHIVFTLIGYNKSPDEIGTLQRKIEASTAWYPSETLDKKTLSKMYEIREEIENLYLSYTADAAISSIGIYCPEAAQALKFMKACYTENAKSGITSVTGAKIEEKGLPKGIVYIGDITGIVADYYQKKEDLKKNYNDYAEMSVLSWFYSANTYTVNGGEEVYCNSGIFNGVTIDAIKSWNKEGLDYFCDYSEIKEKVTEKYIVYDAQGNFELTEEGKTKYKELLKQYSEEEIVDTMVLMLYGADNWEYEGGKRYINKCKNVSLVSPDLFSNCIDKISDEVENNQNIPDIHSLWIAELVNNGKSKKD